MMPDLYVYSYVNGTFVVRKNPPKNGESPSWSSINCEPFSKKEGSLIKLLAEATGYHFPNASIEDGFGWWYFWKQNSVDHNNNKVYEQFILGCIANDINIEIIKWEG
jgi:hypothetical protein